MFKRFADNVLYARIKLVYILFYMTYTFLMELVPVCRLLDGSPIPSLFSTLIGVFGLVLILVDFLTRRVLFKAKNSGLLVLFIVAFIISIIANFKYGFADNTKTMIWSIIQIFLVAATDTGLEKELNKKHFKLIANWFTGLWTAGVVWSIGMFVARYGRYVELSGFNTLRKEGFCEGRLYGAFLDPNYAAMFSLLIIAVSVIFIIRSFKSVFKVIYYSVIILLNVWYIVLSGSRTVEICLYAGVFLIGLWVAFLFFEKKQKLFISLLAAVICGCVCLGIISGIFYCHKVTLPYLPTIFSQSSSDDDPIDMTRPDVEYKEDFSNDRFGIWTDYFKSLVKSPKMLAFGTSPRTVLVFMEDNFNDLFVLEKKYGPHNAYLALFVFTGILGGITGLFFLIILAKDIMTVIITRRKYVNEDYYQLVILTTVLVMFAFCSFSYMILFFSNILITITFWVILGYIRVITAEYVEVNKIPLVYRIVDSIFKKFQHKKTLEENKA